MIIMITLIKINLLQRTTPNQRFVAQLDNQNRHKQFHETNGLKSNPLEKKY